MPKTRKEAIEKLIGMGYTEEEVKSNTLAQMKDLIGEGNKVEEASETESPVTDGDIEQDSVEDEEDAVEFEIIEEESQLGVTYEGEGLEGKEVISETKVKLKVNETQVFTPNYRATEFIVKNEGGGDAYVSDDTYRLTKHDVLRPGESTYIKGNISILLRSASRPTLMIRQYK